MLRSSVSSRCRSSSDRRPTSAKERLGDEEEPPLIDVLTSPAVLPMAQVARHLVHEPSAPLGHHPSASKVRRNCSAGKLSSVAMRELRPPKAPPMLSASSYSSQLSIHQEKLSVGNTGLECVSRFIPRLKGWPRKKKLRSNQHDEPWKDSGRSSLHAEKTFSQKSYFSQQI